MIRASRFVPYAVALVLGSAAAVSLPSSPFAQTAATSQTQRQERPNRIEGRIAFLRTELQITQEQAQLWDTVANVLR